MAIGALADWAEGTLTGYMHPTDAGPIRYHFKVLARDTATGQIEVFDDVSADVASDATLAQWVIACTTAVLAAAATRGMTVPRTNVRLPGFQAGN